MLLVYISSTSPPAALKERYGSRSRRKGSRTRSQSGARVYVVAVAENSKAVDVLRDALAPSLMVKPRSCEQGTFPQWHQ
jgi:hypothetical protein